VAWSIKEVIMKAITLLILFVVPFVVLAQDTDPGTSRPESKVTDFDWMNVDQQGYVMEIRGDSVLFEEQWMIPSPAGVQIGTSSESESGDMTTATYEAPYWAEATYYRKGKYLYFLKLRFIQQCSYNSNGDIIGRAPEEELE
jgi:hypothetical protein